MKPEFPARRTWTAFAAALALAGCSSLPPAAAPGFADVDTPEAALVYYQSLHRLTPSEFARERGNFAAAPRTAQARLLGAMLLYRCVYEVLPLALAVLGLAAGELLGKGRTVATDTPG